MKYLIIILLLMLCGCNMRDPVTNSVEHSGKLIYEYIEVCKQNGDIKQVKSKFGGYYDVVTVFCNNGASFTFKGQEGIRTMNASPMTLVKE